MIVAPDVLGLIGNTPLVRLKRASEATGCEILGKAEFLNVGGSIKDRAALSIIRAARASGALKPGGTIVEGTAGNTGIGLALVGAALGHPVVIVMPRTQTEEKKRAVRLHGARLIEVDPAPFASPNHFVHFSRRLAEELNDSETNGAYYADQFDNLANRQAHYEATGPEIWKQTDGRVDGFICAVGSGGTLTGTTTYLREQNPALKIGLADVPGASLYSWFTEGALKGEGSSVAEGIGVNRITGNLNGLSVDHAYRIEDAEFLPILFDLVREEGLSLGPSSGVNIAGAIRMARDLGPGHTIVTVLCDAGQRYASKIYDQAFLNARGLPTPDWIGR
ncbi:cysteine synthase A [Brevundimonas diminuta]|jgi:cysteine synthase A|uniref:Cysteine synthase A n=1 Tax=Brevundimonas diminuta TaxID=293 RepID=A0A410NYV0_BREDI|nr:cysteine synthase A [Brevundimonas diminuta]MBD3572463.1 cysteine synthase A [Brevundimonas diminuta]QAT14981.1 cysteine synthase A [Brevundimonas diminuta]QQB87639.1 cysteine synthase A [Brevundimonas diminuta]GEC00941.1 cysteine synthase A [Brevundimonas diminuta]